MSARFEPWSRVAAEVVDKNSLFTSEVRAEIDGEISKYPAEWRQSACMAALRIVQEDNGGWFTEQLMDDGRHGFVQRADRLVHHFVEQPGGGGHFPVDDLEHVVAPVGDALHDGAYAPAQSFLGRGVGALLFFVGHAELLNMARRIAGSRRWWRPPRGRASSRRPASL